MKLLKLNYLIFLQMQVIIAVNIILIYPTFVLMKKNMEPIYVQLFEKNETLLFV